MASNYYVKGLPPDPDCPTCKRNRCKPCQKRRHFDKQWNQEHTVHLFLIKSFLERSGLPVKTQQLRELE